MQQACWETLIKEAETLEAIQMSQWVRVLTTRPDDLSLVPRIHRVEADSCKLSSDLHMCSIVRAVLNLRCK